MLNTSRLLGLSASMGSIALWGTIAIFNPVSYQGLLLLMYLIAGLMILLSLAGSVAALTNSANFMFGVFGISFVPVGFYTMTLPGIFPWIGVFNLIYLGAALLTFFAGREQTFRLNR